MKTINIVEEVTSETLTFFSRSEPTRERESERDRERETETMAGKGGELVMSDIERARTGI